MKRPWLLPLVPVYWAGSWVKRQFEGEPKRLRWPVVSVGSLSAGGAGKTPVVLALAKLLASAGYDVDVLSRGFGRRSDMVGMVDPAGTAEEFGDEPLLLARAGLRVWVGADRFAAGSLAERAMPESSDRGHPIVEGERRVHLLDDGFQHRRLARALDVVLLTVADVEDCLLPAGNLREPLSRLRAAGVVVVRDEEAEGLRSVVRRLTREVPVWVVQRQLLVDAVRGPVLAFCGIARPEGFFAMARAAGVEAVGERAFPDHHRFWDVDVERLVAEARRCGAGGFLTTEKDAVRLTAAMRERLEGVGPVGVGRLEVTFLKEEVVMRELAASLNSPEAR